MSFYTIFAGLLLSIFSVSSAASDLSEMLQRMSQADQNQYYQGTFILRKSNELSSLRVTHGNDDEGVWETMEALNGESRKVIRRNNKVVSIYPERKLITVRHSRNNQSLHPQLPENISQLDLFYALEQQDDDRIANHRALVVDLIPRDKLRYGYRYWVDKNTGMLLRCDLVDENQQVVEQMMFTSLEYLPETPSKPINISQFEQYKKKVLDEARSASKAEPAFSVNKAQRSGLNWQVNILPKGFMLTQSNRRNLTPVNSEQNADHQRPGLLQLVYSDGLASVSVFIEKEQVSGKHLQGASSMGVMNAFGHLIDGYAVTVVGEVPMKTVQAMAQSTSKIK